MSYCIEVQNLSVEYHQQEILHNIHFTLGKGKILGIAGESGSGKSTLLKACLGILGEQGNYRTGNILYQGQDLCQLSEKQWQKLRGKAIGMIFQNATASFCPVRRLGEQMIETLDKRDRRAAKQLALAWLEKLGYQDAEAIYQCYPAELSGGMNQRVAIALAMMSHPDLLLADEPTSELDNLLSQQVVMGLKALVQENHTSMIIVSHSLKVLVRLADELMILHDGKCIEYGKTETLLYFPCHPFTRQLIEAWKWSEWHETDAGH